MRMPVLQRLFAGELKHHYLLKDGRLAHEKTPLTAHSNRQRIGYQMLVDESCGAFVDLYPIEAGRWPRLELVYAFLALAWAAPLTAGKKPARSMGLPEVLSVPRKLVNDAAWAELVQLGRRLDFRLESPASGFEAGVHLVKELGKGMDQILWADNAKDIDWLAAGNMRLLSILVAQHVTLSVTGKLPMREFKAGSFGNKVVYERRNVPEAWLHEVAALYGKDSKDQFLGLCSEYFRQDEPARA